MRQSPTLGGWDFKNQPYPWWFKYNSTNPNPKVSKGLEKTWGGSSFIVLVDKKNSLFGF